jgi:hypothetical protein
MSPTDTIAAAIAEFCRESGVPHFSFNDDGLACLKMADGREVFLIYLAEDARLFAAAELRKLPLDPTVRGVVAELALGLNFLQQGTGPAALSLKADGLFCQYEYAVDALNGEALGLGMALVLEKGKIINEAIRETVRSVMEVAVDV